MSSATPRSISLFNTLTRDEAPLSPRTPGHVSLYVCGVTPYDALHIGHARAFVAYDALRRALEHFGYTVRHVQNVTDVDDKIIARARETGTTAQELADRFADEAQVELAQLNVLPAHDYPRVTGHIPDILELIRGLEQGGFAYRSGGDVYFDVSRDDDYGKLSGRKPDELEAGARVETNEQKDDPLDFALWKAAKPGEPSWDSDYGAGRPGWHIECSAMALKLLGPGFDIHGGARELIFPHHENEVAQSESYLQCSDHAAHAGGHEFARVWWHCGELRVDGKKMSKSLGNFISVKESLTQANPNVWRLLFLQTHPGSALDYDFDVTSRESVKLDAARSAWNRVNNALAQVSESGDETEAASRFAHEFDEALASNLNTPVALARVFEAVSEFNRSHDASLARAARRAMETLGFTFAAPELGLGELTPKLLDILIRVRQDARERRDFAGSDAIRDELRALGVSLEDMPDGTRWKVEA